MRTSEEGVALTKGFEGLRLQVYPDIAEHFTIGYGHLIRAGESFPNGITVEQAEALLLHDLLPAEFAVNNFVTVPINQGQFDALVDFTFNLGTQALRDSTLLKLLNERKYHDAADQFPLWSHARGTIVEGLKRRRIAEQNLFLK